METNCIPALVESVDRCASLGYSLGVCVCAFLGVVVALLLCTRR